MRSASLAEWAGKDSAIEVTRDDWPRPMSFKGRTERNRLLFIMSPGIVRGEARFSDYRDARKVAIGSTSFFPADRTYESWGEGGPMTAIRCHFSTNRMAEILDLPGLHWSIDALQRGLNLDGTPVRAVLERIARELRAPGLAGGPLIETLFALAMVELCRSMRIGPDEERGGKLGRRLMTRLRDRIEAAELAPPCVADLAAICQISERHFSRLFRQTTGQRVSDYLRDSQLAKARRLLGDTDLPLKEVAFRLGYSDHSSFTSAFRRTSGDTPKAYRRRIIDTRLCTRLGSTRP